jgi:hypothetical protein
MDKIEVTQADRTLYHQLLSLGSVNLNRRRMGLPIVDGFELIAAHRLATRTDATPVAWMYEHPDRECGGTEIWPERHEYGDGWIETPLYTHPPATDVAALVEAAKETNAALERDGDPAFAHLILANKAALAPFTKGQNDE